jgi:hypothetical protein
MELDPATVEGNWSRNTQGMDFFIINDAVFSKLCILGEDVEPCFEGSSVTAPKVSASFAKVDDNFKQTLFSMMQDLKFALEGGQQMDENLVVEPVTPVIEEPAAEPVVEPAVEPEVEPVAEPVAEPATEPVAASEPEVEPETEPVVEEPVAEPAPEFAKKDEDEDESEKPATDEGEGEPAKDEEEDEEKKKYSALESQHAELQAAYTALETSFAAVSEQLESLKVAHEELVQFKAKIDDAAKDAMINKFFMLSDELEEKKEIVANKANYSLEEIEEKLSVLCFRHKVNFDLEDTSKNNINTETPVVTFNLSGAAESVSQPAWLSAVDNFKSKI